MWLNGSGKLTHFGPCYFLVGLHDIARLILILYYLTSMFKTIIDTIFLYSFDTISRKIVVTRMSRILSCFINFGSWWWPSTDEMWAALLYSLEPTYLGTWDCKEGVRSLAAARELGSSRQHIYGEKNQISNLGFIYTCAEILLFLY